MQRMTSSAVDTPLAERHRSSGVKLGNWFGCALPDSYGNWLDEYRYLRESVALLDKNYRAYLSFLGPDRARYLNALLTNNIRDLGVGHGTVSLFLNPQGHIQAEIETYAEPERLLCISFAMIRASLVPALDKYIIMDDVTLTDETDKYGTLALEGPHALKAVAELTGRDLGSFEELEFQEATVAQKPCRVICRSPGGVPGAEFLADRQCLPALWDALLGAAKKYGGGASGYVALNALRLEQGIPWFGYDFGEKQIPHEAGLQESHLSYTKGCYTGQEIVERVRSRGQVNRVRALLKADSGEPFPAAASVLAEGKEIGAITRSAFSPAAGSAIAMAYLRREKSSPGSTLEVTGRTVTVIEPPLRA